MSADNRSVATDALATLGTILTTPQKRDAIHLAVVPMTAPENLSRGAHVDKNGYEVAEYSETAVGIVDPFLPGYVREGEQFWLVIYPRVITSLRHVWTHPAFDDEVDTPAIRADRSVSEAWMRAWATKHLLDDDDYGHLRTEDEAYDFIINAGHEHRIGSYVTARDYIDSTWWDHWEAITGTKGDREAYFSCSC